MAAAQTEVIAELTDFRLEEGRLVIDVTVSAFHMEASFELLPTRNPGHPPKREDRKNQPWSWFKMGMRTPVNDNMARRLNDLCADDATVRSLLANDFGVKFR